MANNIRFTKSQFHNVEYRLSFQIDPTIDFKASEFIRFLGKNGTGKTAFFKSLYELSSSKSLSLESHTLFYVPQNYEDFIFPERKIKDFIFDYLKKSEAFSISPNADEIIQKFLFKIQDSLSQAFALRNKHYQPISFDLQIFLNLAMDKISGGQKRLLYLIREVLAVKITLNHGLKLLILDEPFNDIDLRNLDFITQLIYELRQEETNLIIFISTHLQLIDQINRAIILERKDSLVTLKEITDPHERLRWTKNRYQKED
jgi:manganese/iron transport system ATP-binding protein